MSRRALVSGIAHRTQIGDLADSNAAGMLGLLEGSRSRCSDRSR
jgi:hypothetical protein